MKNANTTTKRTKRIVSGITAVMMAATLAFGGVPELHGIGENTNAVISVSAASVSAYKKGQRSGSHKAYISKLDPMMKRNAITFCGNCDADVDTMSNFLSKAAVGCSGGKPAAAVIQAGKHLVKGYAPGQAVLTVFEKIFLSMGGVSNSAKKANEKLLKLTREHPLQGFKVTIRQDGDWIIELQNPNQNLEKAYADYLKSKENSGNTGCMGSSNNGGQAKYFKRYTGKSSSISDILRSGGYNNSYSYRTKIYNANNLSKKYGTYKGSSAQNLAMVSLAKSGKLVMP